MVHRADGDDVCVPRRVERRTGAGIAGCRNQKNSPAACVADGVLQSQRVRNAAQTEVDNLRAVIGCPDDTVRHIRKKPEPNRVQNLERHNPRAPRDARHASPVITQRRRDARDVRAVALEMVVLGKRIVVDKIIAGRNFGG